MRRVVGVCLELVDLHPGRVDGAATEPALHAPDGQVGAAEVSTVGLGGLRREHHPEVARDRVEAARVHDACPGALRGLVVGGDAAVHEEHLTGEVAVVGAGLGARGCQGHAVLHVRPDGRDDDVSAAREVSHGIGVRGVDDEQRPPGGLRPEPARQVLEA
jgi:hypothetical protein